MKRGVTLGISLSLPLSLSPFLINDDGALTNEATAWKPQAGTSLGGEELARVKAGGGGGETATPRD